MRSSAPASRATRLRRGRRPRARATPLRPPSRRRHRAPGRGGDGNGDGASPRRAAIGGDGAAGVGAAGDGEIDAALMDELVRLKMQLLATGGGDDDALLALEDADDDDADADADAPRVRGIGGGAASAAGGGAGRYDEGEDPRAADVAGGSEVLRLDGSSDGDGDRYETYDGDAFDVSSRPTSASGRRRRASPRGRRRRRR